MVGLIFSALTLVAHVPARLSISSLETRGSATLTAVNYRGRHAFLLAEDLDPDMGDVAVVKGFDFHNGTIEFDVAGLLTDNAPNGARGFVGIAFRGDDTMQKYENFYLRMTNGRSTNPEQRSHAVQYCCPPEYTWNVLRKRRPGKFEAWTDLEVGAWTHVRIWVKGTEAKFYVNRSKDPVLTVHDLLMGDSHGKIAFWVAGYTKGYFSGLKISAS